MTQEAAALAEDFDDAFGGDLDYGKEIADKKDKVEVKADNTTTVEAEEPKEKEAEPFPVTEENEKVDEDKEVPDEAANFADEMDAFGGDYGQETAPEKSEKPAEKEQPV